MMQRGGQVVIHLLANVQQKTSEPLIKGTIVPGTLVYTDEHSIYARLQNWGYGHKSVNHGRGEFARDDDGDGFCEVHVNTMEGFWSLLRSWLRPPQGIAPVRPPGFGGSAPCQSPLRFEFPLHGRHGAHDGQKTPSRGSRGINVFLQRDQLHTLGSQKLDDFQ
jgi:transposase